MSITTNEKIRVRLESFDRQLLLDSCQKISSIVQKVDPKKSLIYHYRQINEFIVFYDHHMWIKIQESILKFVYIDEF